MNRENLYFTVQEILDQNAWEEFCVMKEINVWAVRIGLIDSDEEFELTEDEVKKLGLIKDNKINY